MALSQSSLAAGLLNIANAHPANEAAAIQDYADEFHTYMTGSAVLGIPMVAALALPAKAAMIAAMTGLNTAGALSIQAGVVAYWNSLNIPALWGPTIAPTVPPPLLATLAAALVPVFVANVAGELDNVASTNAMAAVWHPLMLGGTATLPGPVSQPIL